MLSDSEWQELAPLLTGMTSQIKSYRERSGAGLAEALKNGYEAPALLKYREMTGYEESNVNALWHHRLSAHGPRCRYCGKLLRTQVARRCVECGRDAF